MSNDAVTSFSRRARPPRPAVRVGEAAGHGGQARRLNTFLCALCVICSSVLHAQPTTLPKTPEGAFEVQEWVIFLCDPNQPQANASSLFLSTLPDFVGSRRNPAPVEKENEPSPVGVIRFIGSTAGGEKLDVLLQNKGGRFLATWPKANTRSTGVLWQNLVLTDKPPTSQEQLGAASWVNRLRSAAAPFLTKEGRAEKFLFYDAEPRYLLPLKVFAGEADRQYVIANNEKTAALHDLTFYKPESDGWYTTTLAELAPTKPASPATTKAAVTQAATSRPATNPSTTVAVTAVTTKPTTSPASTRPATGQASSQPTTRPIGQTITLAAAGTKDPLELLSPWKDRLTSAGLAATDQDLILAILAKHALDAHRLTAVYRLDADQLEQMLPLEVTPQPRRTTRVGLVIVKNVDPAIITEVETLVQQLGDPKWDTREAAHKRLAELGVAARPKLEALMKTAKDPEIVYRIERLIATLTHEPVPGQGPNQVDQ
jgi:hypothetical protein